MNEEKNCRNCIHLHGCALEIAGTCPEPFIKTMGEEYSCPAYET